MRNRAGWIALGLSCLLLGSVAWASMVPFLETDPPLLDGELVEGEWTSALQVELGNGAIGFVGRWHGALYVALRGPSMLIGSLLVQSEDEVRVLHASAALGTGVYERDGDEWVLAQGFSWRCRMTGFSNAAVDQRIEFLEENGWLATISRLGPTNEMEYRIEASGMPVRILLLAMTFADGYPIVSWPVASEDVEIHREIITGPLPDRTFFDLEAWLSLEPSTTPGS